MKVRTRKGQLRYSLLLWVAAFLIGGLLVPSGPASATTITSVADDFTLTFSYDLGGGNILSATEAFDVLTVSSSEMDLKITLTNTTSPASVGGWVSAIGFNTNPDGTATMLTPGTYFTHLAQNVTFPGFSTIDVCVYDGNNCSSASNHSLTPGVSDTFTIRLTGSFGTIPSLTLDGFTIKDAGNTITGQSYEFGPSTNPVPEPASFLLMGSGLVGLVAWRRRQVA